MRDAGLYDPALEVSSPEDSSVALGARLLTQLHEAHPDCDGVFLCNDDLAQGALFQCAGAGCTEQGFGGWWRDASHGAISSRRWAAQALRRDG